MTDVFDSDPKKQTKKKNIFNNSSIKIYTNYIIIYVKFTIFIRKIPILVILMSFDNIVSWDFWIFTFIISYLLS